MDTDIVIRNVQASDLDACRGLWRELVNWHRMLYDDYTIGGGHLEDDFDKHLSRIGNDRIWVAVLDSKVVGLMGLLVKDGEAEVEPLIVSKAYRHIGIGTRLINASIAETRRLGLKSLSIKPVFRNVDAIQFFYRRGFHHLGQIELFMNFSNKEFTKRIAVFDTSFTY